MKIQLRNAFTLIEVLIVVVIMAILAATIIPQFTASTDDAALATTEFNLNTIRAQIELFKAQHGGTAPAYDATMTQLTGTTTHNGGTYGPYMVNVPKDTINNTSAIAESTDNPIGVITGTTGGWIYNATTGEIRINHEDHDTK